MPRFRRFLVQYVLCGEVIERYANTVAELREALEIPRVAGAKWSFKNVI